MQRAFQPMLPISSYHPGQLLPITAEKGSRNLHTAVIPPEKGYLSQ